MCLGRSLGPAPMQDSLGERDQSVSGHLVSLDSVVYIQRVQLLWVVLYIYYTEEKGVQCVFGRKWRIYYGL